MCGFDKQMERFPNKPTNKPEQKPKQRNIKYAEKRWLLNNIVMLEY